MEMSQRIHFWYHILLVLLKITIFGENGKKSLFWLKKFLGSLQNTNLS